MLADKQDCRRRRASDPSRAGQPCRDFRDLDKYQDEVYELSMRYVKLSQDVRTGDLRAATQSRSTTCVRYAGASTVPANIAGRRVGDLRVWYPLVPELKAIPPLPLPGPMDGLAPDGTPWVIGRHEASKCGRSSAWSGPAAVHAARRDPWVARPCPGGPKAPPPKKIDPDRFPDRAILIMGAALQGRPHLISHPFARHLPMPPVALALVAHPDDVEFLCAGTLIRLAREHGWEVHLATMTAGRLRVGRARAGGDRGHPHGPRRRRQPTGLELTYHCVGALDLRVYLTDELVDRVVRSAGRGAAEASCSRTARTTTTWTTS